MRLEYLGQDIKDQALFKLKPLLIVENVLKINVENGFTFSIWKFETQINWSKF
jgi:hypothetical protein